MLKRVLGLCALCLAVGAAQLTAQDVFVLPGVGASGGLVEAFTPSPLSSITSFNSGNGSFLVLPAVGAWKFYVIASSTTQTITSTDASFLHPTAVANLPASATAAVVTPDGRLLAVAAGLIHLFDTTTDAEVVAGGLSQGAGINTLDLASSLDATTIYALGSNGTGVSQLTAFSASTHSATASVSLPETATAVAVGPSGLVYVSLPNEILELDPTTLQTTTGGRISVSGAPGRLVFTPDGQFALAANQSTLTGNALLVVTLATHTATSPNLGLPPITSLQILRTDSALALAAGTIYQVDLTTPIAIKPLPASGLPAGLQVIAVSNEVPAGAVATVQNLYAVNGTTIYQVNLATDAVRQFPLSSSISAGALSYAAPPITTQQSRPASMLSYGINQSVLPSSKSQPLVVRVLDASGHPILGVPVAFQSSSTSGTLSPASTTTGSDGYALTYLTAPSTTGAITVTATVAPLPAANFNINVTNLVGGGGPQMTIVAGQGQLMLTSSATAAGPLNGSPLVVLVTASDGSPVANAPVTFSVPPATGNVVVNGQGSATVTVNTGADGKAQVDFLTTTLPTNNSTGYLQTTVTATSTGANPVTFYITTVGKVPSASVYIESPVPGAVLTGPEGTTLPGAVVVRVASPAGLPIPNVSLTLTNGNLDPNLHPTATCNTPAGEAALSNASGTASCDVLFGPRVGAGSFTALVGYTHSSNIISFVTTSGAPAAMQIVQGNNQVGTPGQTLPLALVVHVTDSGGNTITGTPVNFQVVTAGTITLKNIVGTTDSNGNASAFATLGSIGGVAQVKVTAGTASATFNLTVNIPSTGLVKVSGDQQTAVINTAFTSPLVVKVINASGAGLPGAQVNFQVTAGTATLSASSAITDSTGQASTTVTAGATPGTITVTATSSTFSASFTLTAQPPGPTNITIVNGASFDPNTGISPGGLAVIRGNGILPGVQGLVQAANSAGQLPTTFSNVTITFDGTPAPIYYVQDTNGADQVAVQVPFEVQPGSAVSVVVKVAAGSAPVMVPVKPLAPGVFTSVFGGKPYAVAVRPDGTQVSPTNPAQRGENIQLWVTGLGQATPTIATGALGVANQTMTSPLVVGLNNSGVPLIASVYGPGLIGVYIVILQVPADTQTGPNQPVGVIAYDSAGNQYYAQNTYIPIQ